MVTQSRSPAEKPRELEVGVIPMLVCVITFAACASIDHIPYTPENAGAVRPGKVPWEPDPSFDYPRKPIVVEQQILKRKARYEISRITFSSSGDNGQRDNLVTVDYHRSLAPGKHSVVIVLPIWGRQVYPSNAVTRTLRKRSNGRIHVLNLLGENFLIDWPTLSVETDESDFVQTWIEGAEREITTVIDIRRLIDWAEDQPEIDGDAIGLIGFSHGAMLAPAIATNEPRISALVLVMGGAQPHQIIASCEGARTEAPRVLAEKAFGWSRDDMASRLEPMFAPVDAANYPDRTDPSRVLIFESGRDECVPPSSRDALWEAMGRPERYIIDRDHRRSFLSMTPLRLNWMRHRIWDFFEDRLLGEDPADLTIPKRPPQSQPQSPLSPETMP